MSDGEARELEACVREGLTAMARNHVEFLMVKAYAQGWRDSSGWLNPKEDVEVTYADD